MLKKTITYTDYDGVERTEDFYFNLTKAELIEMQLEVDGGLENTLNKMIKTKDTPAIMRMFKKILLASYGVKSDDGRRLMKSAELSAEFTQTPAYDVLFTELCTSDVKVAEFIKAVVPSDLSAQLEAQENQKKNIPAPELVKK